MSPFLNAVRRMRPIDLLLPIGAALISAGLQNLADRESRQRERLSALADLAGDHLEALASAGVVIPDELAVDEPHPLDPGVPWLLQHASPAEDEQAPTVRRRRRAYGCPRRPWKLAALALLGVAGGIAIHRTGGVTALIDGLRPYPYGPADELPVPSRSSNLVEPSTDECVGAPECGHEYPAAGGTDSNMPNAGRETPEAPWVTCLPDETGACANDMHAHPVAVVPAPIERCGWPECDWTSDARRSEMGQRTQAAIHRTKCFYRPAGAGVTPA